MRLVRLLRAALAIALVAIASGAPRAAIALLADDCCVEECEGEGGGEPCPPDCTRGTCVKILTSAVAPSAVTSGTPGDQDRRSVPPDAHRPVLPLVVAGVFHPPRR
jgi:hypothetical protein